MVSYKQHKSKLINPNKLPKQIITTKYQKIKIYDQDNEIIAVIIRNKIPIANLTTLTTLVPLITKFMKSSQENKKTFALGTYLERTGKIVQSKLNNIANGQKIINTIMPISDLLSSILQQEDNTFYQLIINNIPPEHRLFTIFPVFYCNVTTSSDYVHKDY